MNKLTISQTKSLRFKFEKGFAQSSTYKNLVCMLNTWGAPVLSLNVGMVHYVYITHRIHVWHIYTLNYLGSGMGAPQGSGGQRSEMVG